MHKVRKRDFEKTQSNVIWSENISFQRKYVEIIASNILMEIRILSADFTSN